MTVTDPALMNEAFATAFNSRDPDQLLALYEPDAVLHADGSGREMRGVDAIGEELRKLLQAPGTMVSRNSYCVTHGELALLRADWALLEEDGSVIVSGSSAELVRRQADGSWLYVIDHAVGASQPRVD